MFCGSSSRCRGLVCSVWLWYLLIILTFLCPLAADDSFNIDRKLSHIWWHIHVDSVGLVCSLGQRLSRLVRLRLSERASSSFFIGTTPVCCVFHVGFYEVPKDPQTRLQSQQYCLVGCMWSQWWLFDSLSTRLFEMKRLNLYVYMFTDDATVLKPPRCGRASRIYWEKFQLSGTPRGLSALGLVQNATMLYAAVNLFFYIPVGSTLAFWNVHVHFFN